MLHRESAASTLALDHVGQRAPLSSPCRLLSTRVLDTHSPLTLTSNLNDNTTSRAANIIFRASLAHGARFNRVGSTYQTALFAFDGATCSSPGLHSRLGHTRFPALDKLPLPSTYNCQLKTNLILHNSLVPSRLPKAEVLPPQNGCSCK